MKLKTYYIQTNACEYACANMYTTELICVIKLTNWKLGKTEMNGTEMEVFLFLSLTPVDYLAFCLQYVHPTLESFQEMKHWQVIMCVSHEQRR